MKTLLIRDVPDNVHESLISEADRNRRSKEKHALFLIEAGLKQAEAETCGELAERIWSEPAPKIEERRIDSYLAARGRRSRRP
jgi:plasmid stability protein